MIPHVFVAFKRASLVIFELHLSKEGKLFVKYLTTGQFHKLTVA